MPIINRELHASEQKTGYQAQYTSLTTSGNTYIVSFLPNNGIVTGVYGTGIGISNTPAVSFWLYRFIPGATNAGYTFIGLGATVTIPAYGTSGFAFYGATLSGPTFSNVIGITCLQGDLLVGQLTGSNAAVTTAILGGVIQSTDAYVQWPD